MAINILDSETINKIAAGEVVQRPKGVVKELIENSIDANATAITIEIKDGGLKLIRVTDDGCGISSEDVALAFKRHCTSKLIKIEDLDSIKSLGFRGEALSSISAVSKVEFITKRKNDILGTRVELENGDIISREDVGVGNGTTIIVKNLFYNTPARKKFMKSYSTEASHITDIVEKIALSHPNISFKLYINSKLKISTNGNSKLEDVIYSIYGRDIAKNLIKINYSFYNMNISGYVASPIVSKGNRSFENYFINGRYVKNIGINYAIEAGYFTRLMTGQFPFTCILIEIAPDMIDVNIHPAKEDIKFNNEQEIFWAITDAIKGALTKEDIIPNIEFRDNETVDKTIRINEREDVLFMKPQEIVNKISDFAEPFETKARSFEREVTVENYKKEDNINIFDITPNESIKKIRIIGQAFKTYWIVEIDDVLYIMDQHAAHEKVLFEKFRKEFEERNFTIQQLAIPIQINLNSLEFETIIHKLDLLRRYGFDVEEDMRNTLIVRGVPYNFYKLDIEAIIKELINGILENKNIETNEKIHIKIATLACKAAIKGNNTIDDEDIKILIQDMLQLENPYQCPHGRPTVIRMSKKEIDTKFARII